MERILALNALEKRYRDFTLGPITLAMPAGCIMGLIGPNGAGKTTLVKLVMNIIRADAGAVEVFGLGHDEHENEIKNRIGYVGETQYFYENRSVDWHGRFVAHYFERWNENRFTELLGRFELNRRKKARDLSKGMRVKLSLAIALSHDPELLVLDEPTAGLDPVARRDLLELLRSVIADDHRSVLISSHITDDIERTADYITYLVGGGIILSEEKDELTARWKRIHFKAGALDDDVVRALHDVEMHAFGSSGIARDFPALRERIAEPLARGDAKVENVDLDDILISFVKGTP